MAALASLAVMAGPALVAVVPVAAVSPSGATTDIHRVYQGETSQGQPIQFTVTRHDGTWALKQVSFGAVLRCGDGERTLLASDGFWRPPIVLGERSSVSVAESGSDEVLRLDGGFGAKEGSGTLEARIPALTKQERPQACTSQIRGWSVTALDRTVSPCCLARLNGEQLPILSVTSRFGPGAPRMSRSWTRTTNSGAAPTVAQHRPYEGSTSQKVPIVTRTTKRPDSPWRLTTSDINFRMGCQSGDTFNYELLDGWGRHGPRLADGGTFVAEELSLFQGFRLRGRLGPHGGSGRVEDTQPEFNALTQPILCRSNDRAWSVERV